MSRVTDQCRVAFNARLRQQNQRGIEKYGRPLETFNGRDAWEDAWTELVDLAQYLTQIRMEEQTFDRWLKQTLLALEQWIKDYDFARDDAERLAHATRLRAFLASVLTTAIREFGILPLPPALPSVESGGR